MVFFAFGTLLGLCNSLTMRSPSIFGDSFRNILAGRRTKLVNRLHSHYTIIGALFLRWIRALPFGALISNLARQGSRRVRRASISQLSKRAIFAIILALSFVTTVAADTFEDAEAARGRGDYAVALSTLSFACCARRRRCPS